MMQNLQRLSRPQRQIVFFLIFGGILLALIGLTALLVGSALNSARQLAVPVLESVLVREFAALPDDDAYPAAVAAAADGVYTGSYATGAIWLIDESGRVTEIPGTRDAIGAVSGLAVGPDGALYVVDQKDTDARTAGGDIKRVTPAGSVTTFAAIPDERGFVVPDDIALDAAGRVYVTDRARNEIWRFDPDGGSGVAWWSPPEGEGPSAVTGLAYDPATDSILATDPERSAVYRIAVEDALWEVVYQSPANSQNLPGFDGLVAGPNGEIYVAALGQNVVMKIEGEQVETVARGFRGASDVDLAGQRLYVANWDQSSLVLPLVTPRLPFAIDVIEFDAAPAE